MKVKYTRTILLTFLSSATDRSTFAHTNHRATFQFHVNVGCGWVWNLIEMDAAGDRHVEQLWTPNKVAKTNIDVFRHRINKKFCLSLGKSK